MLTFELRIGKQSVCEPGAKMSAIKTLELHLSAEEEEAFHEAVEGVSAGKGERYRAARPQRGLCDNVISPKDGASDQQLQSPTTQGQKQQQNAQAFKARMRTHHRKSRTERPVSFAQNFLNTMGSGQRLEKAISRENMDELERKPPSGKGKKDCGASRAYQEGDGDSPRPVTLTTPGHAHHAWPRPVTTPSHAHYAQPRPLRPPRPATPTYAHHRNQIRNLLKTQQRFRHQVSQEVREALEFGPVKNGFTPLRHNHIPQRRTEIARMKMVIGPDKTLGSSDAPDQFCQRFFTLIGKYVQPTHTAITGVIVEIADLAHQAEHYGSRSARTPADNIPMKPLRLTYAVVDDGDSIQDTPTPTHAIAAQ
ncbi:uncharacterized protein MYCFIDRAFT_200743 [Pseudocercospora fijiensis CIRAD86]|uniref:Uncharacterized protein n=1 Tax=Pseudocercospora fijiensis (strain CIRAD86) TaxID=383855 RepID=M2ZYL4_PSEFD|nr:uncharacterized protein MYCFIDRAFT_200743 [Pseudocercospora fijiensis CIRAD86]EME77206.1 hypothetical protein MYCFIDRAFT_200743 [Pseudocercospora fijiensis CIRAD86]